MSPSAISPVTPPLARKPRVVALGKPQYVGNDYLEDFAKDFDFSVLEAYTHSETVELLPKSIKTEGPIDAFIIRMGTPPYEPFDRGMLGVLAETSPKCRIITSASAGYNEFPVEWLAEEGIWFTNTVDAVAEATADMAMFLILAVLRNTTNAEKSARAGTWRATPGIIPARDPSGLTLGIVGLGAIGKVSKNITYASDMRHIAFIAKLVSQYLAKKAAVFNLKIKYFNRHKLSPEEAAKYGAEYCGSLHELLACSDIVSLNCPLNASTTNLISSAEFSVMKDGVFLVNTARGAVIDERALKEALESGKVARAGLDVFCDEPNVDSWFLQSEKVIVQPHLGGLTDMAFQRAERECFENIRAVFRSGKPNSPVIDITKGSSK